MLFRGFLSLPLGVASLWTCFVSSAPAAPAVVLWDTGTPATGTTNLEERSGWKVVPSDLLTLEANPPKASSDPGYYGREYTFKGDAVVENQKLVGVFSAAKGRFVLYSKPNSAQAGAPTAASNSGASRILELFPSSSAVSAAEPSPIGILRNADDEVVLQIAYPGSTGASVVFGFGRTEIVDVKPSESLARFTIAAPFAYVVAPAFVGDDLIFGPQDKDAGDALCLPSESLLLGLLNGEGTELVMTWPQGKQQLGLGLGAEANGRRAIEAIDFQSGGQSFYLAALAAPGIWHKETLSPDYLEKEVAIQWKKPFPARWKTELYEEALKTTFAFRDFKGEIWRGVPGSYNYPVWFQADEAFYHLSKKIPPKGESVIYFLEGQGTPDPVLTPVDILKATLGRPMSEPIVDVAGRKLRTHHRRGGDGVHRACTCGCTEAIQAVFESGDEVDRKEDIKGDLEDMVYFVHAHVDRINEYRHFADELVRYLDGQKAAAPELTNYVESMEQIIGKIPQEYSVQQENMKSFAYADELVQRTLALTQKKDPGNLKAYMDLLKDWRAMGGAQDYVLAQCHIIVRRLAQEAGYGCASQPKAVALAEEIRARARQCLRNPDGYEIWADY